jgi:hypothetical protein
MSDDATIREELAAIELLLGRDSLWAPVLTSAGEPLVDDTRDRFERRRDELAGKLSVTKVTTLTGYSFLPAAVGRDADLIITRPDLSDAEPIGLGELLPVDTALDTPYDIEISITIRPHCVARKESA